VINHHNLRWANGVTIVNKIYHLVKQCSTTVCGRLSRQVAFVACLYLLGRAFFTWTVQCQCVPLPFSFILAIAAGRSSRSIVRARRRSRSFHEPSNHPIPMGRSCPLAPLLLHISRSIFLPFLCSHHHSHSSLLSPPPILLQQLLLLVPLPWLDGGYGLHPLLILLYILFSNLLHVSFLRFLFVSCVLPLFAKICRCSSCNWTCRQFCKLCLTSCKRFCLQEVV
jgi:hypothetical protein